MMNNHHKKWAALQKMGRGFLWGDSHFSLVPAAGTIVKQTLNVAAFRHHPAEKTSGGKAADPFEKSIARHFCGGTAKPRFDRYVAENGEIAPVSCQTARSATGGLTGQHPRAIHLVDRYLSMKEL